MNARILIPKPILALRWTGRVLAVLLVLFWGGFFVEHLMEWFVKPWPETPPAAVWLGQAEHLLLLVALAMLWRWEVAGAVAVITLAAVFFAGKAGANFPLFFALTALPAALVLAAAAWQHRGRQPSARV
jgi:predicted membrane-bound mannosyltransferase